MDRIRIQKLPVDRMNMDEALDRLVDLAKFDQGECARIFFLNAHCANLAWKRQEYRRVLEDADLVLADGSGVASASRIQRGGPVPNINGTDLFPLFMERLSGTGLGVYFLGAKRHVVEALVSRVSSRWPDVVISGYHSGFFQDPGAAADAVAASGARVLFVAMGVPRQELWIHDHSARTRASVALAVGGLFDFYSGCMPRAPLWMRRIGLEWVFRLIQEPSRMWRRYLLGNIVFLARSVWLGRSGGRS